MGFEKEGSKSGGSYASGFFQLFDWTAKSRKNLFSNKSDLPGRSKQGKKSSGNLPRTHLHLADEHETGAGSRIKENSDYSCASSVTDDEGCGIRAPGVVARLMGLDTLPISNSSEAYSAPIFESQSFRDACYHRKHLDYYHDHQIMHSGNFLSKVEDPARIPMESKPHKMLSRPIEKFQTETLPPKSAKSIPITHHKLLSPIKSHGFIPAKNAAHIMEAAAKIIEPGPQAAAKAKMPLVGSSSVPLKIWEVREKVEAAQRMPLVGSSSIALKVQDQKEKMEVSHKSSRLPEASRRPVESNASRYLKGQSLSKSWNGLVDTTLLRASPDAEEGSLGLKNKGKSISLAIQAKVNVQRREGLGSNSGSNMVSQKEQSGLKSSQPFKSQPSNQRSLHKKSSTYNGSGVLRQNNQKQNSLIDKDRLPSKLSVSKSQGRKILSGDPSLGQQKSSSKFAGNSKINSRKLGQEVIESEKDVSYSSTKDLPRKKRSIDGEFHFKKNKVADYGSVDKNLKKIESNLVTDRHLSWTEDSRKKGMDVISFTFTAPLARSMPATEDSSQVAQKNNGLSTEYQGKRALLDSDTVKLSSRGYNVIGGDALSMLLEQKLRELTHEVESSNHNSVKAGSAFRSSSLLKYMVPTLSAVSTMALLHDGRDEHMLHTDKMSPQSDSKFSSTNPPAFRSQSKFQGLGEIDECSGNHLEARQLLDCRHPSPVSILEPSFSTESCNSSDSTDSSSTEATKPRSSIQAEEVIGSGFSKSFHSVEGGAELSDSASSTSTRTMARKQAPALVVTDLTRSTMWEQEYVKEILCYVELMFKDFALGRVREIINPHLFDQLESRKGGIGNDDGESRLRRKVLFDSVSECLDLRCRRYVGGGCRTWAKGVMMVRKKEWLAEEVYKEISGWRGMGDCMVDELVDKDMSSQYGRWLDFEVDAFVLGVEIESQMFNSLVDEVVADILLYICFS